MADYVCSHCIEDAELQKVVEANASNAPCSFCDRHNQGFKTCDIEFVLEQMRVNIESVYEDPEQALPWDEDVRASIGIHSGSELFAEINWDVQNDSLRNYIHEHFSDHDWCMSGWPGLTEAEIHEAGWDRFSQEIRNKIDPTNHVDTTRRDTDFYHEYIAPSEMLERLSEILWDKQLILDAGRCLFRVRVLDEYEVPFVPYGFTSPPLNDAMQPNRMSPAGVSMFYGADDLNMAYLETVQPERLDRKRVWAAQFETTRSLHLMDLYRPFDPGSFFAPNGPEMYQIADFLRSFRREIAKPIERDRKQHIGYAPTQALTAFIRDEMKPKLADRFDGIVYLSSKARKPCYVIFADQDQCLDTSGPSQLLRFLDNSLQPCDRKP